MNKGFKRIISTFLTLSLILGSTISSMALENDDNKVEKNITINQEEVENIDEIKEDSLESQKDIEEPIIEKEVSPDVRGAYGEEFLIPAAAIAPEVFIAVGLAAYAGYTIYDIYKASKSTAREIEDAWNDIPSRLKDRDGTVGIGNFDNRISGNERKNDKTGYTIEKDRDGHKGSKWKLKDKRGRRVASLDSEGRVVGK